MAKFVLIVSKSSYSWINLETITVIQRLSDVLIVVWTIGDAADAPIRFEFDHKHECDSALVSLIGIQRKA